MEEMSFHQTDKDKRSIALSLIGFCITSRESGKQIERSQQYTESQDTTKSLGNHYQQTLNGILFNTSQMSCLLQ